jgi:polar amino acid transport system permease protein/polar amino acid transport system substrate-binding protein
VKVWVALVFSFAFASSFARSARADLAEVRAAGVLRWGGDLQGGEPYVYEDPARPGRLVGFEVELAAAIAREMGVRQEFVQNDWANLVPSLERGTFDVILNGLEVTEARRGRILFTRPYYLFAERLTTRRREKNAFTASLSSLRGHRVGTMTNTYAFDLLRAQGVEIVPYEGPEEAYTDLTRGRTDAVLLDDIMSARYGERKPELAVVGDVEEGSYAIGVRPRDGDLLAAVDGAVATIAKSGELRGILTRAGIWNARQERLSDPPAPVTDIHPAPARLGWGHVVLFLKGAAMTLLISTLAMIVAIPLGLGLALVRLYAARPLAWLSEAYVEIYRGTPVLLQLYVLYYGLAGVLSIDALTAAVLGLGMNYAAYEAETYRAGIQAVPKGQMEAAAALGMSHGLAIRRILLPQAVRVALPNVTNDFIALLKDSALVSVVTVVELTKQMQITAVDTRSWLLPGLLCAALYFAMSYPLSRMARALERWLTPGGRRAPA